MYSSSIMKMAYWYSLCGSLWLSLEREAWREVADRLMTDSRGLMPVTEGSYKLSCLSVSDAFCGSEDVCQYLLSRLTDILKADCGYSWWLSILCVKPDSDHSRYWHSVPTEISFSCDSETLFYFIDGNEVVEKMPFSLFYWPVTNYILFVDCSLISAVMMTFC